MAEERLQKILSRAGLGSRRACEELIQAGRVSVDDQQAVLGLKVDATQARILVDGRPVELPEAFVYVAIYKPRGVLSTVSAPDPRPTVRDLVDIAEQIYPVGRLDVDSEGLMLLTNDGELANRLTHPRYGHEKEYRVLVARRPDEEQLANWRRGVVLSDGYRTAPARVFVESTSGKGAWLRVVLGEGRKRQIRETGMLIGLPVVKIIRVRIGTLQLGNLRPRQWRLLTPEEVAVLKGEKTGTPILRKTPEKGVKTGVRPRSQLGKDGARKPAGKRVTKKGPGDNKGRANRQPRKR